MRKATVLSAFVFFALAFSSCEETILPGREIQPADEGLAAEVVDTFTVRTWTVKEDSIRSDEPSRALLGNFVDPVFGSTKASFYTQFLLPAPNIQFGDSSKSDVRFTSVALDLVYDALVKYYGTPAPLKVQVYEMTQGISIDQPYYSNQLIGYGTLVGTKTFTPSVTDKTLQIQLDTVWARNKFVNAVSEYASNATFQQFFKGLYVTVEDPSQPSEAVAVFDLTDAGSVLRISYIDPSVSSAAETRVFASGSRAARVNHFDHQFSGKPLGAAIADTSSGRSSIYLLSMGGTRVAVEIPYLDEFAAATSGQIVINTAQLIVPAEQSPTLSQHPAVQLVRKDEGGQLTFIRDYYEGNRETTLSSGAYTFNVVRHISGIYNNNYPNTPFYIVPASAASLPYATVLAGSTKGVKLKISYTRL